MTSVCITNRSLPELRWWPPQSHIPGSLRRSVLSLLPLIKHSEMLRSRPREPCHAIKRCPWLKGELGISHFVCTPDTSGRGLVWSEEIRLTDPATNFPPRWWLPYKKIEDGGSAGIFPLLIHICLCSFSYPFNNHDLASVGDPRDKYNENPIPHGACNPAGEAPQHRCTVEKGLREERRQEKATLREQSRRKNRK